MFMAMKNGGFGCILGLGTEFDKLGKACLQAKYSGFDKILEDYALKWKNGDKK